MDTENSKHREEAYQQRQAMNPSPAPLRVPGYISVREAARIMGVSERSVYGYIESGRLPGYRIGSLLAIDEETLNNYQRPVVGRPRTRTPIWRVPVVMNLQYLLHITVLVRSETSHLLEQRLIEIRSGHKHLIPGTVARYIARNKSNADEVQMVLVWRKLVMPPEHEREAALNELRVDLADILDWETASYMEGQVILNT